MEQYFAISAILGLTLYLGSITYLLGAIYQLFVSIKADHKFNFRQLPLIALTRLSTITLTLLVWHYWTTKIDIQFVPFLLPAVVSELLLSPLFLRLFGYSIW